MVKRTEILAYIDPKSSGKICGIIGAIVGFIVGVFFSIFSILGLATNQDTSSLFGLIFGVSAIILLPIFYGILGFLQGVIGAWIYNVLAKRVGGIKIGFK
mgnify:CR=1 FL=1